jgi:hypothetical protein
MVEFWWRQNPKAQYPGKTGMLRSGQASGLFNAPEIPSGAMVWDA